MEWGSRKDRWIRNLKMWVFSSQLCPLPAWPLTCHLSFMEFLFYPVEIIITNLKEYFSGMMWVKVLGLINKNVWNLCQCLGIRQRESRDQAHDASRWEGSISRNKFIWCSQQEALFPSSVKSWNILTIYYALHSNTPLQLNPNITSSLIFTRTL